MKLARASFLFLFLAAFINSEGLNIQQKTDSLSYYSKMALYPQNARDLNHAYSYFTDQYQVALKENRLKFAINNLYYQASIEYKKGNFDNAEKTSVKALKLLQEFKEDQDYTEAIERSFFNLLGLVFKEQKNIDKAIELYQKALSNSTSVLDSVKIYNNTSLVYRNFDQLTNAKNELLKAYNLLPRIKDSLIIAKISDNLGHLKVKMNELEGIDLINKALDIRIAAKDTSALYTSYSHLATYYSIIDDKDTSKYYALKAYDLAHVVNSALYKTNALGLLTNLSEDDYARNYKRLRDSLYNEEKASLNKFALIRYDNSEFQRKALEHQLKGEEQRNLKIIYLAMGVIILLISISSYFILRAKHKKEKLQEVYETESRISQRIHDEVANDLFQVMTKLENIDRIGEDLKNELHTLYHKTRDISKEHDLINSDLPFLEHLTELIESFNDAETSIIVKGISDISWDTMPELNKKTIYKVLQELLINMRKHSKASIVVFLFEKYHKTTHISYSDNGVGCTLKKVSGLQNTENRIHAINGSINFETEPNKGFKTKISI